MRKLVIPKAREGTLRVFCNELIEAMEFHCKKRGFELYVSTDGQHLEVVDPQSKLPDGYEYVALIEGLRHDDQVEGDKFVFDICELIDEDL